MRDPLANPLMISEYLGRKVLESERESIPTLNDVSDELVATIRSWQPPHRMMWGPRCLEFFVKEIRWCPTDFAEDVFLKNVSAKEWERGDALYAAGGPFLTEHAVTVASRRKDLDCLVGEKPYRIRLSVASVRTKGEIGILVRDKRYWQIVGENSQDYHPDTFLCRRPLNAETDLEYIADDQLDIAIRRWQASALSWNAGLQHAFNAPVRELTLDDLIEELQFNHYSEGGVMIRKPFKERVVPSIDALIGLRAIVAESKLNSPDFPANAGFLGSDDWYR